MVRPVRNRRRGAHPLRCGVRTHAGRPREPRGSRPRIRRPISQLVGCAAGRGADVAPDLRAASRSGCPRETATTPLPRPSSPTNARPRPPVNRRQHRGLSPPTFATVASQPKNGRRSCTGSTRFSPPGRWAPTSRRRAGRRCRHPPVGRRSRLSTPRSRRNRRPATLHRRIDRIMNARLAVHLAPHQLPELQRAARALLRHPLITSLQRDDFRLILKWELALRNEFGQKLGYRLDVSRSAARLLRRPASLTSEREPAWKRAGRSDVGGTCTSA